MSVQQNLAKVLKEIEEAALLAGRKPEEISLVAVTKGVSLQMIEEAYTLGCRDFAEARVPEALSKITRLPKAVRWHFVGKLQKNKVAKIIGRFKLIHSVDTPDLAEKIARSSQEKGIVSAILLEVNTSEEKTKAGLSPAQWKEAFLPLLDLQGIEIQGLMTMAPLTENESLIRQCFSELRHLRDFLQEAAEDRCDLSVLSMGMSNDFAIAIQEGATILRIGSAIFTPK